MIIYFTYTLVAFFIAAAFAYNKLISLNNSLERANSGIDVALKQRFDLLPNLVEAVSAYMKHEKETFTEIAALRSAVFDKNISETERLHKSEKLSGLIDKIMVAVEAYPELRASENFQQLQRAINEVEERLSASRRNFNAAALAYNNGIEYFPYSVLARPLGYKRKDYFKVQEAERARPRVRELL